MQNQVMPQPARLEVSFAVVVPKFRCDLHALLHFSDRPRFRGVLRRRKILCSQNQRQKKDSWLLVGLKQEEWM